MLPLLVTDVFYLFPLTRKAKAMKRLMSNRYVVIFCLLAIATVVQLFRVFSLRELTGFTMTGLLGLIGLSAIAIFAVGLYNVFERSKPPLDEPRQPNPMKHPNWMDKEELEEWLKENPR